MTAAMKPSSQSLSRPQPPPRTATPTLKSARRARVLAVGVDGDVLAALSVPSFDGELVPVGGVAEALRALVAAGDAPFDVVLCNARTNDDSGIDLYRLVALHRPALARRIVFVVDDGTSARAHWFLGDLPNATVDAGIDGRAVRAALRRA